MAAAARHSLHRWIVRAVVSLLLGAAVNVAVAWGCASGKLPPWGNQGEQVQRQPDADDRVMWRAHAGTRTASGPVYVTEYGNAVQRHVSMHEFEPTTNTTRAGHMMSWMSAGWPMHSMSGGEFHDLRKTQIDWQGMYFRVDDRFGLIVLLKRPMPVGFTVNTVFYGLTLWLLCAIPFALRRGWRVRKGRCPRCAYPVGENDVCTECGCELRGQSA